MSCCVRPAVRSDTAMLRRRVAPTPEAQVLSEPAGDELPRPEASAADMPADVRALLERPAPFATLVREQGWGGENGSPVITVGCS